MSKYKAYSLRANRKMLREVFCRCFQLLGIVLLAGAFSYVALLIFFRGIYPLFVRDTLNGMLVSLYGAADLSVRADTRLTQGLMFMNGTLLSLSGTLIVSAVAYFIVTRTQEKATNTALNIERLRLLKELESDIEAIQAADVVYIKGTKGFAEDVLYPYEAALTRSFRWAFDTAKGRRTRFIAGVGRMEMFLADNESLIATSVLHQTLHWYRRVDRARDLKLVTDDDLYLMWRYILTLSTDGRFRFIDCYFAEKGHDRSEDVDAIRRTLIDLIIYVAANEKSAVLGYLEDRVDPGLLEEAKRKSLLPALNKIKSEAQQMGQRTGSGPLIAV